MSEDKIPEWLRVKREMESLWKGSWDAIEEMWDRVTHLEKRVERLERQSERSNSRPLRFTVGGVVKRPLDED